MLNRSFLELEIGRELLDPMALAHALRLNVSASAFLAIGPSFGIGPQTHGKLPFSDWTA
jgi:hypothetical protein